MEIFVGERRIIYKGLVELSVWVFSFDDISENYGKIWVGYLLSFYMNFFWLNDLFIDLGGL